MSSTGTASGPGLLPRDPARHLARHRSTLVVLVGLVAALVVAVWLGSGTRTATPMDPDNPGPDGARALARVLADEGVQVRAARDAEALEALEVDAGTTVVVVLPELLGTSTVERLRAHTAWAGSVVVVAPGPGVADLFGAAGGGASTPLGEGRDAGCADGRFSGLRLEVDQATVYRGAGCFDGRDGAVVVQPEPGLTLFGADQALTNDQVLRADNAAVALRLLGQHERLVWYVPSLQDLVGEDGVSLQSLLPRFLRPGLALVFLAAVALVLWRARRLGPLAAEPLPVVVRAVETTRSLGRMYRRSGDRGHAAESLRRAARSRLAERLALGSATPPDVVVREVARRTGRDRAEVARLLGPAGDVPSSDRDLVTFANALTELDREVGRR